MKIKPNYVLRKIADVWTVLPVGEETLNFDGMMTLNEAGVLLWNALAEGCNPEELAKALTDTYEVTAEQAMMDAAAFVDKLRSCGCMEE